MATTDLALGIDFVGNSAGLQDAVLASQRALQALNRDSSRMSFTLGRIMRTIVTPIAGVILSAFAAKKALADFTASTLPGVSKYNQALGLMQMHMFRLSSAVGELLAPMATRVANIISTIAQQLEPMIRTLSANMPAIQAFFKQLGLNLINSLRPLMPTVFGYIDAIVAKFQGMNWGAVLDNLLSLWVRTWSEILSFTSPILIRLATLVDTLVEVVRDGLGTAWQFLLDKAQQFGITIPAAMQKIRTLSDSLKLGILTAVSAIEVGLKNLPLLFELVVEAGKLGVNFLMDNWKAFGNFLIEYTKQVFLVVGRNIGEIINKSIFTAIENGKNAAIKAGYFLANPQLADPKTFEDRMARFALDVAMPSNMLPRFDFKGIPADQVPQLKIVTSNMDKFNDVLERVNKTFGTGIAQRVRQALAQDPSMVASVLNGLPSFWGGKAPAPRPDQFAAIGPLLFGTREAAARESNQVGKNPLIPLAQQANQISNEQLVVQRAAAKAAARKARIAAF